MNPAATLCAIAAIVCFPLPSNPETCPNVGVSEVPSKLSFGPNQVCGSGMSLEVKGLTVRDPMSVCPSFAIYEPPHHTVVVKAGRQVAHAGANSIVQFTFRCVDRWLLGFLPIPIGSRCEIQSTKNVGTLPVYLELACTSRVQREPAGRGTLPVGR